MDNHQHDLYYQEMQETQGGLVSDIGREEVPRYMAKVMGWMCVGLFTTLVSALAILMIPALFFTIFANSYTIYGIFIAELVVVIAFSAGLQKFSPPVATLLFLLYAALTGATFSALFLIFELESLVFVFGLTGITFLLLALYGYFTKKDLTSLGSLCLVGLIGIILTNVINLIFLKSEMIDLAICCIGIVLFIGLIAFDTQKIKGFYLSSREAGFAEDSPEVRKLAIYGALALYLDFINLFLRLLRIFGKRR